MRSGPSAVHGPRPIVIAVLMGLQLFGDVPFAIFLITEVSVRQTLTPPRLLGRTNASVHFLTTLVGPLGALTAGLLATQIGIRVTLLIAALGMLSATAWLLFSPVRRLHDSTAGAEKGEGRLGEEQSTTETQRRPSEITL
ncbi:MAG: hypothetical protein HY320_09500 [Armatimonadetes bacterium]|nr:hypothetical protein [Armatimonadota bacterium]